MNQIKIKLNRQRWRALAAAYEKLISVYTYETAHEYLLFQHVMEMSYRLDKLCATWAIDANAKSISGMKFCDSELVAFCQVWTMYAAFMNEYEGVIIQQIKDEVHHVTTNSKLLNGNIDA